VSEKNANGARLSAKSKPLSSLLSVLRLSYKNASNGCRAIRVISVALLARVHQKGDSAKVKMKIASKFGGIFQKHRADHFGGSHVGASPLEPIEYSTAVNHLECHVSGQQHGPPSTAAHLVFFDS
jgi:hypothetical protein